jgi:ABC-type transporter Mla MlaB component
MLQIDIEERDGAEMVFILGGEISRDRVSELMSRWNEYKLLRNERARIVDVSKLDTIDSSGEFALRCMACDGARFRARGPMMGRIIDLVCKANVEMLREGHREFRSMVFCG